MKVISTELGQVSRIFVPEEIRPSSGAYVPELIRLVTERYGFTVQPTIEQARTAGAVFRDGRLISGNKKINIPAFGIYSDGVSVTAFDTDTAEFILEDAINWGWDAFNLRKPISKPFTLYESQIVVEFERPIDTVLRVFEDMKPLLESAFQNTYGLDVQFHLSGTAIGSDPRTLPKQFHSPHYRTEFRIDRRLGHPYSENRYFCFASLRTQRHIELLETFEKLAMA